MAVCCVWGGGVAGVLALLVTDQIAGILSRTAITFCFP